MYYTKGKGKKISILTGMAAAISLIQLLIMIVRGEKIRIHISANVVYMVERIWDSPIEFLLFAYVIVAGIYLSMEAKMRMYDMSSSIVGAYEKMEEYEQVKKHSGEGAKIVVEILREVKEEEFKQIAVKDAIMRHCIILYQSKYK